MVRVGQLIKHIANLNPQGTQARLALFNYLNHFFRAEDEFGPDVINSYFSLCLEFPHWQQCRANFGPEIKNLLENFLSTQGLSHLDLAFDRITWPQEIQIIELERLEDFCETVHSYLTLIYNSGEKFRLINDGPKKIVAVILTANNNVVIRIFNRRMLVRGGILEPVQLEQALIYNSELQLFPESQQLLEITPYTWAKFTILNNAESDVVGSALRGYLFQKVSEYKGQSLDNHSRLFFSVKRLEQFFIDRNSDSYYSSLQSGIERSINMLKMNAPQALPMAQDLAKNAEVALEQVFVGDKMLTLLLRDLKVQISHRI